ncbi:MAG: MaoC/PaaZ C-terminal domain-containing protein [Alphaproteobacteria bacterium]
MAERTSLDDIPVGYTVTVRKTISESDVYLFAGITGDYDPIHVDEEFAKTTPYRTRIAHGALVIGLMSTASSQATRGFSVGVASLGFDRIRHTGAVFFGDTLTVTYEIASHDPARNRATAHVKVLNQRGETVGVGEHVLKIL